VATDDLHSPLGLDKPTAGRPIIHSVAAAALGIATAALVIGAAVWYEPLTRSSPAPAPPQAATPTAAKAEPAVAVTAPIRIQVPAAALPQPPSRPQVTGSVQPDGIDGGKAPDASQSVAAPGRGERIITIIDGRSGTRQEVKIPAGSDAANAPLADPGPDDLAHAFPSADDAPEPPPPPSRAKPTPQKRSAKPGPTVSTNSVSTSSASQAPLR
jgi:hypothetical protein